MHHADAEMNGRLGVVNVDHLIAQQNCAGGRMFQPVKDFHQGAFARAVLAHQGMDLALLNRQVSVIVRQHPIRIYFDYLGCFNKCHNVSPVV